MTKLIILSSAWMMKSGRVAADIGVIIILGFWLVGIYLSLRS